MIKELLLLACLDLLSDGKDCVVIAYEILELLLLVVGDFDTFAVADHVAFASFWVVVVISDVSNTKLAAAVGLASDFYCWEFCDVAVYDAECIHDVL